MARDDISGVHCIENKINGHWYIGSSATMFLRRKHHFCSLSSGKHPNNHLQNSYDKYGKDAFEFQVLSICDKDKLIKLEQWFIDKYNPEYNLSRCAGGPRGMKHSDETRRRMGIAVREAYASMSLEKKRKMSESRLLTMSNKTVEEMEEISRNRSNGQRGKKMPPFSDKRKENLSAIMKAFHAGLTEEQKKKIYYQSPESRDRSSEETRRRMSEGRKKKKYKHSEESKRKISIARREAIKRKLEEKSRNETIKGE